MTNAPAEGIPEDFRSRHGMEPEAAAFFYRRPSQLVAECVLCTPTQGNSDAFICDGRILLVDTSGFWYAPGTAAAVRDHSEAPVEAIVYSHGHIDHVTGAQAFIADARARGYEPPKVAAHRNVPRRFDRYKLLDDSSTATSSR